METEIGRAVPRLGQHRALVASSISGYASLPADAKRRAIVRWASSRRVASRSSNRNSINKRLCNSFAWISFSIPSRPISSHQHISRYFPKVLQANTTMPPRKAAKPPSPPPPAQSEEEEESIATVPPQLLQRLLQEFFEEKGKTRISQPALSATGELTKTFIREAIWRAAAIRKESEQDAGGVGGMSAFLEVCHFD